jgi:hypothetical protein
MKIQINSSLVPTGVFLDDATPDGLAVVSTEIPQGIVHPQFVNGEWREYSADADPCVIHANNNQFTQE